MSFLFTALIMFCFWMLLSGHLDVFHILTGALSSLFVAHVSHDLLTGGKAPVGRMASRAARFLRYLPWLFLEIAKANVDIAYRTLHPRMPIDPRIVRFNAPLKEDMWITALANSITLTPGTVTIDADGEGGFTVHALTEEAEEALLSGDMQARVARIEGGDV